MTTTKPKQLSVPSCRDILTIDLRSHIEFRAQFYDMIHEDALYDAMETLEIELSDGWVFLYTLNIDKGLINVCCSPEIDMSRSIASRWNPDGHDGFKIIDSVYANDRQQLFEEVIDRAKPLASKVLRGDDKCQWLEISEEDAIVALRAEI